MRDRFSDKSGYVDDGQYWGEPGDFKGFLFENPSEKRFLFL